MKMLSPILLTILAYTSAFNQTSIADSLYLEGNFIEAIKIYEKQLPADSTNVQILDRLANAYFQTGNTKKSKELYLGRFSQDEENISTIKKLASIYEIEGDIPKALKHNLLLTKLLPNNGIYFRKVATLYLKAGETKGALEYYNQAYTINNKDLLTVIGLSEMLLAQDQVTIADTLLWQAIEYDHYNIACRLLSARSKYKQKQYDSVIAVIKPIKGRVDFSSYYNKLLGYSYMKLDSLDKAIHYLHNSLVNDGSPEKAHYYLSEAYSKKGDKKSYVYHLEKAIEAGISDNIAKYHRNMAKHYDDAKNIKAAIPHYEAAYRYSKEPRFLFFLARAYDAYYADKSTAVRYYKKYIDSADDVIEYKNYAKDRRRALKEQIHLSKK